MGDAWGAADLAISRAGASSVAEAAANAVPTIFLPYPWHRDLHQRRNAEPLVAAGGAMLIEDRIEAPRNLAGVGPTLQELLVDDLRRQAMREALRSAAPADAAMTVAATRPGLRPPCATSGLGQRAPIGIIMRSTFHGVPHDLHRCHARATTPAREGTRGARDRSRSGEPLSPDDRAGADRLGALWPAASPADHPRAAEERDHRSLPRPHGQRAPQALQGVPRPAQQRTRAVQGRSSLPPSRPASTM